MTRLQSIGNTKAIILVLAIWVFTFIVGGSTLPQKPGGCLPEEDESESETGNKNRAKSEGCILVRKHGPINLPLMTTGSAKIYPLNKNKGNIILSTGSKMTVSCSPESNSLANFNNKEEIGCTSTGLQDSKKNKLTFKKLGCKDRLHEDIKARGSCYDGFTNISIEFNSAAGRFPLITACHDNKTHNTLFTRHIIHGASIEEAEKYNGRPTFKAGPFYESMEPQPQTAYQQDVHKETVEKLVGSSKLADKYINKSKSFYLCRGHMSPDGDFDYVSEQNATYYFVNVFPQWQSINNGNWKALEVATRKLAAQRNTDLEIYSGGYDVLKLRDKNEKFVKIYLAYDGNRMVLPVPRLTWKLVHDIKAKSAVVIIIVNNPHDQGTTSEDVICKSICDQITWVKWDFHNIPHGYTYCCDVASFSKQVKYAPKVSASKLLT